MNIQSALVHSVEELQRRVDEHRRLLSLIGEEELMLDICPDVRCSHQRVLRETLAEAIEVLEDTRSSFKSKRLEVLRKKMLRVLAENG